LTTPKDQTRDGTAPFEQRVPTAVAAACLSVWIVLLSLPIWTGAFLGGRFSDQFHSGYAFRHWLAEQWSTTGAIPLWNAEMFGGFPFVGAMHGDIFYPTSLLRLILPTGLAMSLGFVVHYVLAGLFVYLLLRLLRVSWTGAVVGGFAYQLSGVIGSYVQPGHDGKLFVSTLLPLALISLILAIRDRKWWGYGVLAVTVGLALVSPHAQMTYYMLIVAGFFALYLTFGESDDRSMGARVGALAAALGAVVLGFGIGMIQLLPFFEYLPYSPRAEGYYGFEGSVSYAIPWSHVPEFFLSRFVGTTPEGTYWGANPLKLHSEYLGLAAVGLGAFGCFDTQRRRLVAWLLGIGLLFLLISLGGATPFYRVWWTVMPFVQQTRAPGMALYAVALILAILAGIGVDRWTRDRQATWATAWTLAGGTVAVLAVLGAFGGVADVFAQGADPGGRGRVAQALQAARPAILSGALTSGLALLALGGTAWIHRKRSVPAWVIAVALPLIVSTDLWLNARPFWKYSERPSEALFAGDAITRKLQDASLPYRVVDLSDTGVDVYPGASLMAFGIPQILGHHGNQLHDFNELLGGKNEWRYLLTGRRLWDLFAVQYVLLPSGIDLGSQLPAYVGLEQDFDTLLTAVPTAGGGIADLLIRREPVPYARVVPGAVSIPDADAIPNIASPQSPLPLDRVVLLSPDDGIDPEPLREVPEAIGTDARLSAWAPGSMTIQLEPALEQDAYVVVSENHYPGWQVWVDGQPGQVVRGNVSMLTVPVAAGASEIRLEFASAAYERGRLITILSLVASALLIAVPAFRGRMARA
jgi:hypothetical protein